MSPDTRKILERVASWPEEDQDELAEVAANIEARRIGVYRLTEEERGAVEAGLADARAGRFATDQEIDAIFKKARSAGK
jgi:predicted transcriptional regulator